MQRSAFILSLLLLAGCAQKNSDQSVTSPADFVAVTLGQAAENAHSELAMLAKLRGQGLQPLLLPADPALNQPVSIAWTGPAEGALKEVCLSVGYRYQELGSPSPQALMVVVRGLNRPAHMLLESLLRREASCGEKRGRSDPDQYASTGDLSVLCSSK